jgi:hypothetical protein
MRWVKHMTQTCQDEKISRLISEYGHAGYGLWWMVVETVASRLEKGSTNPSVTYPVSKWAHLLSLRGSLVRSSLSKLEVTHLVTVEWTGSEITVTIPNLLKYRDEYQRKSGHSPDSVPDKSIDTETEIEIPPKPPAPNGAGTHKSHHPKKAGKRTTEEIRKALGSRLPWWEEFWKVYPCHEGMNPAMDAFERRVHDHDIAARLYKAAKRYQAKCLADPTIKMKYAQGWINDERWTDEDPPKPEAVVINQPWRPYDPETLEGLEK